MPVAHTCDGKGYNPPVSWINPPAGVQEFVLTFWSQCDICADPAYRWIVLDIPPTTSNLPIHSTIGSIGQSGHGEDKNYYIPPCGEIPGYHTSTFTLYALNKPLSAAMGSGYNPKKVDGVILSNFLQQNPGLILGSADYHIMYCHLPPCTPPTS